MTRAKEVAPVQSIGTLSEVRLTRMDALGDVLRGSSMSASWLSTTRIATYCVPAHKCGLAWQRQFDVVEGPARRGAQTGNGGTTD